MKRLSCIGAFYQYHPERKIGDMMRTEVIPYVRKLEVLPEALREESIRRGSNEDAETFLKNLLGAWRRHNELAYEIDEFLMRSSVWSAFRLREESLLEASKIIQEAIRIEDEKRIYSASVKICLDAETNRVRKKFALSDEQVHLLVTLWEPTYWTFHDGAHACWLLQQRGVIPMLQIGDHMSESRLCELFHAGYVEVLMERLKEKPLSALMNMSDEELLRKAESWARFADHSRTKRVQLTYLLLERAELRAIQELIRCDNLTEILFGFNLFGIPDLFLRRFYVNTCIHLGALDQRESVLFYAADELRLDVIPRGSKASSRGGAHA